MFRAKKYIENLQISIINGSSYGNILKAIEIAYLEGQVAVDIGCGCNRTIPKTSSKMKCLNMNCEHYWLID